MGSHSRPAVPGEVFFGDRELSTPSPWCHPELDLPILSARQVGSEPDSHWLSFPT